MLVSSDYDLSLSLRYEEPVKEALKETILKQEYTFKKQVYELHRLYDTQKIMMKDLSWKELDGVYFSREGRQANPVAYGNCIRPSSMPAEKRICSVPKVLNWLQEKRDTFPGFQQRLSNPQICSPHYLDHIAGKNLNKRPGLCSSLESIERNHYYHGGVVRCPEEVNLSLSIGRNHLETSARTKTFNHIIDLEESDETLADTKTGGRTKTWKNIIDLEESDQTVSNAELKPQSPLKSVAQVSYSGYKRHYQSTQNFTNTIKDYWFDGTPRNYFVPDGSTSCVEQNSFAEGAEQCEGPLISDDISAKRKIMFSDERAFLDLNKSISDDSFHSRESHGLADEPRGGTFPHVSNWRERNDNSSNETSAFVHQRILNSATGSSSSYKSVENVGVDQFSINLNQQLSKNSGSPCSPIKNSDYKKSDLIVEFRNRDDQAPSTPEMKSKKAKQDAVSSPECKTRDIVKDTGSDRSPSSCKSSCFEDTSSGVETMQSGTQLGNSSSFHCNAFQDSETLKANKSPHQEDVDSSSNSDDLKGKASEVDGLIIRGAVSLVYLALECSEPSDANRMKKIEGENIEQPQSSLDSFEEMVLKQPESSVDDYSVTSNAFEVNDTEGKDNGITLKRGRRMKDFQRDIMPSLATLSRHEIFEDIKIMETALRSREYKRLRSKTTSEYKWFNPVRNRRSRLNYVGRKHYS
ncbi:uncharacterized protein [Nicotiana tomentosiformis]|uniref:uncharacterized protein n=1 Tax=Nicotiana tomentosiformis TaxID=4098 RepID=UPI00051B2042|nr:uncharacterized protein LOC104092850 isoform X1 [Nicotiana tomentosiformis]XP_009596835.1 uncharacterized protein LOC104092850 isoform X1 [Nicotiana tomentosiformis]XP_018625143.1 uncharacterized protein LOC104092850 isoform X1 [Nicotiana tomentosiformis]XP_018625145.1 uncharacterized protein LOC104092850 isoform X1 [Nicotiana tomentosiformis]